MDTYARQSEAAPAAQRAVHMVLDVDTPFGGWHESGMGRGNGLTGLLGCMESNVVRIAKSALAA